MRSLRAFACGLLAAALLFSTAPAQAAPDDHLDCFKVKDTLKSNAIVDLTTQRYGVESGCKVKVKSAMLCTPATKVLASSTAPALSFDGQSMTNSKLCYKVKCPKVVLPNPLVLDQFGQRTLSKLSPKILCTPANVF
jgi:hypothetical protein